jgi:hypothetical protein
MTVILTLTTAGSDSGPFDLYSNTDGYVTAFEIGVTKSALEGGYTTSDAPNFTTTVKVQSTGKCNTYTYIILQNTTTTTTTRVLDCELVGNAVELTTTTTTTIPPLNFDATFECTVESINFKILNITGGVPFALSPSTYLVGNMKFASEAAALANTSWLGPTNEITYGSATVDSTWWLVVKDSVGNILAKSSTSNCL